MVSILRMRVLTTSLVIGLVLGFCSFVRTEPNTKVVDYICNGNLYDKSGPFALRLAYVLEALQNVTPNQGYTYYSTSPYPNDAIAYGHATCNSIIEFSDCGLCLSSAKSYLLSTCDGSIGGQVEFANCSMRNFPVYV
ncbi:antifungal protein ginkbilobin-like protein [Lycium barbarum]|uniref:antifungal protein ginkbilobin-like protein n=1 Tax=Lycium barbarum TaxID=112863 RepID=UPI00293E412B|nr:antifungal protein ginkbilobin-like protein [Lycium barbarum]